MESFELIQYLQNKRRELSHALQESKKCGIALADAERQYKKEKAKFIAKARLEKVAVTLIGDLAKGHPEISELRHKRDVAKVLYWNAQEAINVYKLECRLVEAQIKREWEYA